MFTNEDILAGELESSPAAQAYRALVAEHTHNGLCRAYGLDQDHEDGGTYWGDVVAQAYSHGDINGKGELT